MPERLRVLLTTREDKMPLAEVTVWPKVKGTLLGALDAPMPAGLRGYAIAAITAEGVLTYGANFPISEQEGKELAQKLRYMAADILATTKGDRVRL